MGVRVCMFVVCAFAQAHCIFVLVCVYVCVCVSVCVRACMRAYMCVHCIALYLYVCHDIHVYNNAVKSVALIFGYTVFSSHGIFGECFHSSQLRQTSSDCSLGLRH